VVSVAISIDITAIYTGRSLTTLPDDRLHDRFIEAQQQIAPALVVAARVPIMEHLRL